MTRVTKMARKKHVEASGFNVVPLKQSESESTSAPTSVSQPPQSPQPEPVIESRKRPAEEEVDHQQSTQLNEPAKKAKRVRHRSLLAKDEQTETTQPEAVEQQRDSESTLNRKEREVLKRRSRKEKLKEKKMTCFLCRQNGHSIKNCPRSNSTKSDADLDANDLDAIAAEMDAASTPAAEGICYRCGSANHSSAKCKKKMNSDNPYPFASCFVCKQQGHLASACPKNEKGLYPNGGGCKFCGSVKHRAKDCKPALMERGVITLGKIDLAQGGDDDDVFINLRSIQKERGDAAVPAGAPVAAAKKPAKKKVVKF